MREFAAAIGTRSKRIRSKLSKGWTPEQIKFHYETGQNKVGGAPKPVVVNGRRFVSIEAAKAAYGISGFWLQRIRAKHQVSSEEAIRLIANKGESGGAQASIMNDPQT
ncbi:hypothetical protein [Ruegeria arenilitoris]|uniref:hypothetical protein n=1 Tax=Ruegeria arenilitoris TaxID=1173585 RepID=UPI00147F76D6|nr:hypothetical protein [Ruegeria arenilitoris]